jgi:hypothetical protein
MYGYLPAWLPICQASCLPAVYLPVYLSTYLATCVPVCVFGYLPAYLLVCLNAQSFCPPAASVPVWINGCLSTLSSVFLLPTFCLPAASLLPACYLPAACLLPACLPGTVYLNLTVSMNLKNSACLDIPCSGCQGGSNCCWSKLECSCITAVRSIHIHCESKHCKSTMLANRSYRMEVV